MQKWLKMSQETKIRISNSLKWKSKGCTWYKHTDEARKKISEWHVGKWHKQSNETKLKISNKLKWLSPKNTVAWWNKWLKWIWTWSKNCNWKWWVTDQNRKERSSIEYKLWRDAVFARDGYTCRKSLTYWWKLEAHHILNFSTHPELRLAIDNWITFSKKEHKKFHKKYWNRNNTREQVIEFIWKKVVNLFGQKKKCLK